MPAKTQTYQVAFNEGRRGNILATCEDFPSCMGQGADTAAAMQSLIHSICGHTILEVTHLAQYPANGAKTIDVELPIFVDA